MPMTDVMRPTPDPAFKELLEWAKTRGKDEKDIRLWFTQPEAIYKAWELMSPENRAICIKEMEESWNMGLDH